MAAELVDMKRTKEDKKAEQERWSGSPAEMDDYPYGLSISLDDASIKKLGLGDIDAEQSVMLCAECFVSEDSARTVNGKTMRSLTLQLRKIAIDQSTDTSTVEETLYGK